MKRICALILCAGMILLGAGCATNKTRVAEGSVIGGVLGAAAGAGIGSLSGNAGAGAGIGAAVGAISGGLIGSQMEKPGQGNQTTTAQGANTTAASNPNQMSIQQIAELSKQGVHEDVIIDKIRLSNSKFRLSAEDLSYLRQQGVSQKVLDVMQGSW